nr:hypothetical protein [Tanacetum cinerariifolium]
MEDLKQQYLDELQRLSNLEYHDEIKIAELNENFNDQIVDFSESNEEFFSIDHDSFSIYNIDYVEASPPDYELVSSEVMEIVISETKSSSTSLNSFLEETNTFDNSLLEFETFCFDVKEISSGSTTAYPDISLSEYEAFHDDHVKEISSGSPTTYSDSSLHASFIFDLSIRLFPFQVAPHYLLSLRNEDTIFDPGICNSYFSRPDVSHRCGTIKKFNTHRSHLNECPMLLNGKNTPPLDVLLFHFYPLDPLKYGGIWSSSLTLNKRFVKEYKEKDKIGSKQDKNGKRGEARRSQKQLQWNKKVKLKKIQKEGPEMQSHTSFMKERRKEGLEVQFAERYKRGGKDVNDLKLY